MFSKMIDVFEDNEALALCTNLSEIDSEDIACFLQEKVEANLVEAIGQNIYIFGCVFDDVFNIVESLTATEFYLYLREYKSTCNDILNLVKHESHEFLTREDVCKYIDENNITKDKHYTLLMLSFK